MSAMYTSALPPEQQQQFAGIFPGQIRKDQFIHLPAQGGDNGGEGFQGIRTPESWNVDMGAGQQGWGSFDNNYSVGADERGNPVLRLKSGDKQGTVVPYMMDASGNYVPDWAKANGQLWDTNKAKAQNNWAGGIIGAGLLGTGIAAAGAISGAAGGTAGGAAGGASAVPGGASWGYTLPGLEAGGAGWGTAASTAATTAGTAATTAGTAGGTSGTIGQILQGAKYLSPAMKLLQGLMPGEQGGQPGRAGPGGFGTQGGVAGQGGNIQDLLAAYYAAQQNKDYSGNMKRLYSEMEGRQKPFLDQLNASYQDPNSFYGSNQWKGLESVYQNSIDRKAASQGRLANPTDREVLLQNYGMKELENYRSGLRQNAATFDPARLAPMAQAGYQAERNANSPLFGAIGNIGAQPGGWQSWFQKLIGGGGGGGSIPGFPGGIPNLPGTPTGPNPEYGSGGDPPEMNYPEDPQWGSPGSELPGWMYPQDPGGFESEFPMPDGGSDFDPNWFEGY